jgi:hypothetical protein
MSACQPVHPACCICYQARRGFSHHTHVPSAKPDTRPFPALTASVIECGPLPSAEAHAHAHAFPDHGDYLRPPSAAYTLPPPPPIRILKHLCDFVPGCPRLARVCQPLWPFASCTCFRVVKDPSKHTTFSLWNEPATLPFVRFFVKRKTRGIGLCEFPSMPPPFG